MDRKTVAAMKKGTATYCYLVDKSHVERSRPILIYNFSDIKDVYPRV